MKVKRVLWLMYKRMRVGFAFFGLILMYGAYTNNFTISLLLIGLGFTCIELFGACYNDYQDYEEDVLNNRKDKLILTGLIKRKQMRNLSFFLCFIGLLLLWFMNLTIFLIGLYYSFWLLVYSHPKYHLKRYNVIGYGIVESVWLLLPISLSLFFLRSLSMSVIFLTFFCFFQYVYLLCQKDSTDLKDKTNLFLKHGWKKASFMCIVFASMASLFLFIISFSSIILLLVWIINGIIKIFNIHKIYNKNINRKLRSRLILGEFLTPYFYIFGVL